MGRICRAAGRVARCLCWAHIATSSTSPSKKPSAYAGPPGSGDPHTIKRSIVPPRPAAHYVRHRGRSDGASAGGFPPKPKRYIAEGSWPGNEGHRTNQPTGSAGRSVARSGCAGWNTATQACSRGDVLTLRLLLYSLPPRPVTGVVSVDPFFAKIIASSCAGSVWLGLPDSSCTEPGGSKNISPTL